MKIDRLKRKDINPNIIVPTEKGIKIKKYGLAYFKLEQCQDLDVVMGVDIMELISEILRKETN